MAKQPDEYQPTIFLWMYTDNFQEVDYIAPLSGPFDLTNPIQALQLRAKARGMGIIVQAACVPLEQIYGEQSDEQQESDTRTTVE